MADAPETQKVTLDAAGISLSALLAEPAGPPRAVVVAIHGGGMRAGYFDSRARPGLSLLELGVQLGYSVLAVDRPGYGASTPQLPEGQTIAQQAATLHAALGDFAGTHATGAGFFLVAHSNGGKIALAAAAGTVTAPAGVPLVGLDISGLGSTLAVDARQLPGPDGHGDWRRHWGALRFYPPDAFRLGRALVSPVPGLEAREGPLWPRLYPGIAALVTAPVRFTFAEQEQWWRFDEEAVAMLKAPLSGTKVTIDHQPDAGHNISLGWAARTYHLRAMGFLEECLLTRDTAPPHATPVTRHPQPATDNADAPRSATHLSHVHV